MTILSVPTGRAVARATALIAATLLAACASVPPAPATPRDQVLASWGAPSARYALPGGAERLEYATGPFGRTTWMIDLGADGRVTQARQVLTEADFLAVQGEPGLAREALLRRLGTPGERRGARGGGETWSWRWATNDCLWFQASLDAAGTMTGAAFAIDPACDAPNDRD